MWRRLLDVLGFRHSGELDDERSTQAKRLAELAITTNAQTDAIRTMTAQSRSGRYGRIRADALRAQQRMERR